MGLVRHDLPLVYLCWLLPITLLFFIYRRNYCTTFPGTEMRLTVSLILLCALIENESVFCLFFQSSGTSPSCYELLKMIECSLTMTPASSFSTLRCTPSGTMDLRVFSWLKFLCTEMNTYFALKQVVFDDQPARLLLFVGDAEYRLRTRR